MRDIEASLLDRGPAKHFRGRETILRTFRKEMRLAEEGVEGKRGTIVLVQGPPDAGKTALLAECMKEARTRRRKWEVARTGGSALYSPAAFMAARGKRYRGETAAGLSAGIPSNGQVGARPHIAGEAVSDLMRKKRRRGLLLVPDEAQALGAYAVKKPLVTPDMTNTLNRLHNGEGKAPVILLAGGPGNSAGIFSDLQVSRWKRGRQVNLGRLSEEAERAVIHD